jgi:hypothetical protein
MTLFDISFNAPRTIQTFSRRLFQASILFVLIGLFGVQISVAASIKAAPSTSDENRYQEEWFSYKLTPGQTITDSLKVKNDALVPLNIGVSAYDYQPTAQGSFGLSLVGQDQATQVGQWIDIPSKVVSVPARDYVEIPFSLTIPADIAIGQYAGGITAQILQESMSPVAVDLLQGTRVYITVVSSEDSEASLQDLPMGYKATDLKLINPGAFDESTNQPYRNVMGRNRLAISYTVSNETLRFGQLVGDLIIIAPSGKVERLKVSQEIPAGTSSIEHFAFVENPYEVGDYTLELIYNLSDVLMETDNSQNVSNTFSTELATTLSSTQPPLLSGILNTTETIARSDLEDVSLAQDNLFDQPINLTGEVYERDWRYGLIWFGLILLMLVGIGTGYRYYKQKTTMKNK